MKASVLYRIASVLLVLFALGHSLVFAGLIPNGEWTRLLAPCGQFTLMYRGSPGVTGTSMSGLGTLTA